MNGKIVAWDSENGEGAIRDASGSLRTFMRFDLVEDQAPSVDADVQFTPAGEDADLSATFVKTIASQSAQDTSSSVISDIRIPFLSVLVLVFKVGISSAVLYVIWATVAVGIRTLI